MATQQPNDDERRSDLAVMDANEYKQKRRLERILDAVENVEDKADEAWDLFVSGQISKDAKNIMIQRAVQRAIREVYKLLVDHEHKKRPAAHSEYLVGDTEKPIGKIERQQAENIQIIGLYDYMKLDLLHSETLSQTVTPANKPPQTQTYTREYTVSEDVSWVAYLRLKEFLDEEHDLEITFEELEEDKLPMIRDFDESLDDGDAESTDVEFNGTPEL